MARVLKINGGHLNTPLYFFCGTCQGYNVRIYARCELDAEMRHQMKRDQFLYEITH